MLVPCLRGSLSDMSKNVVAKPLLSGQDHTYQWLYFGTKIPLKWIRKRTRMGTQQSLLTHIKTISGGDEKGFNIRDVVILPSSYMPGLGEDLLFVLNYRGCKIDVHADEILHLDELFQWHAWKNWKSMVQTLHNGEWSLHISDIGDAYVSFYGKRYGCSDCPMVALSLFDILPNKILEEVREKRWRIAMENPDKALKQVVERDKDGSMYVDAKCASLLMGIPLACYSVMTGERDKTMYVDVRDLKNIYFPRSLPKLYNQKYSFKPCTTPLDLFDAMMLHGKLWSVDTENDLLYLPCLPCPPKNRTHNLTVVDVCVPNRGDEITKGLHKIVSLISKKAVEEILGKTFPYVWKRDVESQIQELLKRVEAYGSNDSVKPGSCIKLGNKLVCMIPRPVISM